MALDSSIGTDTANSYCSVVDADAYHATRDYNTEWTSAATDKKELYLQWATRNLDAHFRWRGNKVNYTQALGWPRWNCLDKDGFAILSNIIPRQLIQATAEYAFQLMKDDWTQGLGPVVDDGVQIGTLKTTKEQHRPIPNSVAMLISHLVKGGAGPNRAVQLYRG